MGGREVSLRSRTVTGDEIATTREEARVALIIEAMAVRVSPTYRGQRSYEGVPWAATNEPARVYESLAGRDCQYGAD